MDCNVPRAAREGGRGLSQHVRLAGFVQVFGVEWRDSDGYANAL